MSETLYQGLALGQQDEVARTKAVLMSAMLVEAQANGRLIARRAALEVAERIGGELVTEQIRVEVAQLRVEREHTSDIADGAESAYWLAWRIAHFGATR